ncbi:zinc finger, C6HC-type containing protein, partial [Tanacetum coccineum]
MFCFDCIRETLAPRSKKYKIKLRFWNDGSDALCESLILGAEKFYCPFKDCSALLVDDGGGTVTSCGHDFDYNTGSYLSMSEEEDEEEEEENWIAEKGISCSEYQTLKKDERDLSDLMLRDLAKYKAWKFVPKCNFYVELASGCLHIRCRCGHTICYGCGKYHRDHRWHKLVTEDAETV